MLVVELTDFWLGLRKAVALPSVRCWRASLPPARCGRGWTQAGDEVHTDFKSSEFRARWGLMVLKLRIYKL